MNILVLNGSPRPKGNTRQMGVFTAHGSENGSKEKLDELRDFGQSLK